MCGRRKITEEKGKKPHPNFLPRLLETPLTLRPLGEVVCLPHWALVHRLPQRSQHWRTPHRCQPDNTPGACNWRGQSHDCSLPITQALLKKRTQPLHHHHHYTSHHPTQKEEAQSKSPGTGLVTWEIFQRQVPWKEHRGLGSEECTSEHASGQVVGVWCSQHKMQWVHQQCSNSQTEGEWKEWWLLQGWGASLWWRHDHPSPMTGMSRQVPWLADLKN